MTTAQPDTDSDTDVDTAADPVTDRAPGEEASSPAMEEPTADEQPSPPDATEAAPNAGVPGGGSGTSTELTAAMDRVSLDQALQDFAVANARVLDLTRRLTSLTEDLARLNDENAQLRIQAARLRELEASSAYQVVRAGRAGAGLARKGLSRLRRR